MNLLFTAVDPNGKVYQATSQKEFERLLRDLRIRFPNDYITARAEMLPLDAAKS